jgi:hypothetical protein
MDLEFLEYINTPAHEWNVCIGVPYATHLWQVADSSQINGKFKIEIAKEKCEYMQHKTKNTTGMVITDIVPIVKGAFRRSFSIVKNAKKAIAERGWGPALNYRLLLDPNLSQRPKDAPGNQPDTAATIAPTVTGDSGIVTMSFNMKEGWFADITDALVEQRNQDEGRAKAMEEKVRIMKNKEQHIHLIKNLPKISSGQLMANGWLRMDTTVRDNKRQRKEADDKVNKEREGKRSKIIENQQQRYQAAINKCVSTKQALTMVDLRALVKQASVKGDTPIEKNRTELIQQLERRFDRLQRYLPVDTCNEIKLHIINQHHAPKAATAAKVNVTAKSDKTDMFDNLDVVNMSVSTDDGTRSTTPERISHSKTMGSYDVPADTAGTLLHLANGTNFFFKKICPTRRGSLGRRLLRDTLGEVL